MKIAPVLAVAADTPFNSVAELVHAHEAKPDELTFASSGVGSYMHIAIEYFKHMAGVKIVHVPTAARNVVVPDLLAGRVAMYIATLSVFDQYAKEGKLKALAAATEKPLPQRPELPTMGETVPGYFIEQLVRHGGAGRNAQRHPRPHQCRRREDPPRAGLPPGGFVDKQSFTAGDAEPPGVRRARSAPQHAEWRELVRISGAKTQ